MTAPRRRHVIVSADGVDCPGLALEVEQRDGVWWVQVTYIVGEKAVTEWLPGDRVTPVRSQPYTGSAYG